MKISREDVLRVAELAYLDLSDTELETYRAQIDEILEYIGKLNELDTANVEPMAQVLSDDQTADATLREDLIVPCAVADGKGRTCTGRNHWLPLGPSRASKKPSRRRKSPLASCWRISTGASKQETPS
ncbi:MAG: Asp-tRNA(Asn)/Glu-tRNA(Gln) amidotransferase GatCAB subunit C [Acidobacteria bacterium]|nr:MAG: Asp-tRNA(Asn)/Glu-tRNA(Gln) amidotransferase GatCAB subunit C [Acidobacteriota bacterium]